MRPAEFWRLHPTEFWWLAQFHRPRRKYAGMTEAEVAALYEDTFGDDDAVQSQAK